MDYAHLESRLRFLDSEYRREKADLAQLRQQLDLRDGERQELLKRIEALEAELVSVKTEYHRIDMLENKFELFKNEVMKSLENQREKQRQALKDAEHTRSVELASHTRAINEIRREVERNRALDELITLARTETERLAANQTSLQQRIDQVARQTDDQLRSIAYLEEQRRADTKRVSELQNDIPDLSKRINLQISKIELLEQQIPQFGQFQIALEQHREIIRAEVERSQHQLSIIERQLKRWDDVSEAVVQRLEEFETRLQRYAEHYQINLKALEELQTFQDRMSREQREFIELQRLSFDRQQSQLQKQEAIQEKQIKDQALELDKRINEVIKSVKEFQASYKNVLPRLDDHKRLLTLLLKIVEEDTIMRANSAVEWRDRFEQLATEDEV